MWLPQHDPAPPGTKDRVQPHPQQARPLWIDLWRRQDPDAPSTPTESRVAQLQQHPARDEDNHDPGGGEHDPWEEMEHGSFERVENAANESGRVAQVAFE